MKHTVKSIALLERRIAAMERFTARDQDDIKRRPILKEFYLPIIKQRDFAVAELKEVILIMKMQNKTDEIISGKNQVATLNAEVEG